MTVVFLVLFAFVSHPTIAQPLLPQYGYHW